MVSRGNSNGARTGRTGNLRRGAADADWKDRFLDALSLTFNVRHACKMAVVARDTVYRHRNTDDKFRAAWDKARDTGLDRLRSLLEENSLHRAIHGTREGVWFKGKRVGWKQVYYPGLEQFFLERLIPGRYYIKPKDAPAPDAQRFAADVYALVERARGSLGSPEVKTVEDGVAA